MQREHTPRRKHIFTSQWLTIVYTIYVRRRAKTYVAMMYVQGTGHLLSYIVLRKQAKMQGRLRFGRFTKKTRNSGVDVLKFV